MHKRSNQGFVKKKSTNKSQSFSEDGNWRRPIRSYQSYAKDPHPISNSSQSLSEERNGRSYTRSNQSYPKAQHLINKKPEKNERRKYPIGYKAMENLLDYPPDEIVLELLLEKSGYFNLLEMETLRDDFLVLLMKVLYRASLVYSNVENMVELLSLTFNSNINRAMINYSLKAAKKNDRNAHEYFHNLASICKKYVTVRPYEALSRIDALIDTTIMCLNYRNVHNDEIKSSLEDIKKILVETEIQKKIPVKHNINVLDQDCEPPDDFRVISVVPTKYDLFQKSSEVFLRRNIVSGKYKDANHYLDVQFRLLREDFVRPFREGISHYRFHSGKRNNNLRIFKDVSVSHTTIDSNQVTYYMKIKFSIKFDIQNSKSLLHGNLVCLSDDNFENFIIGYIQDRSPEMCKKGIIGINFLHKPILGKKYVMAESRAYFIAYKHVLEAIQKISEEKFPFPLYILNTDDYNTAPEFLEPGTVYNMDCLSYQCRQIQILSPIHEWPSSDMMHLDDSQRRALHYALTRQFSIVQGPPGTGKTFLGLKIVEIILRNMQKHISKIPPLININNQVNAKNPVPNSPILVVCYTNHALDQFLEGMVNYTHNIVRIGSRTKSEIISQFNINYKMKKFRFNNNVSDLGRKLSQTVDSLVRKVSHLHEEIRHINNPSGIFTLEFLKSVIPDWAMMQLHNIKLRDWLVEIDDFDYGIELSCEEFDTECNEELEEEEQFHDALSLLEVEEQDRILDFDVKMHSKVSLNMESIYDTTLVDATQSIRECNEFIKEVQTNEFFIDEEGNTQKYSLEEVNLAYFNIHYWEQFIKFYNYSLLLVVTDKNIKETDIFKLGVKKRWSLYKYWCNCLRNKKMKEAEEITLEFEKYSERLAEVRNAEMLAVMRASDIVGLTTTGAARLQPVIQQLSPKIVIIEEAAEILEAHLISSLTSECQQLILIGDHQQLRPSTIVYEIATKYGLELSLFERMIKNGVSYQTLEYQHRMRPEISSLISPHIYEHLKDHSSVIQYECIKGISKNLFFIDHKIAEKIEADDNRSHENEHEAHLMIALCRHLILQGYDPENVTILTPYSGQFFLLRKIQRNHKLCADVKICIVDNFQGEENDIILLSLVRSNEKGNVGFLKTDNRVCVALSRAKKGLFITGNMDQLMESSKLWKNINETLEAQNSIGAQMNLECTNHQVEIPVSTGDDILFKSPEGGCRKICGANLPNCNHSCPRICHIRDSEHMQFKCLQPCQERCKDLGHPCKKECFKDCGPCMHLIEKSLPCGHKATIPCHQDPVTYKCKILVKRNLSNCGHENEMECSSDLAKFPCSFPCKVRLDCGHQCRKFCHVNDDPDHDKYDCTMPCERLNIDCSDNHKCTKKCFEDCGKCNLKIIKTLPCEHTHNVLCHEKILCKKKCNKKLPCGHFCQLKCHEECGRCDEKVAKTVPECGHTAKVQCSEEPKLVHCNGPCKKLLSCGHECKKRCMDPCTKQCKVKISSGKQCPRNHIVQIECYKNTQDLVKSYELLTMCSEPCSSNLLCGHICKGKCGTCLGGRLHENCRETCNRVLICGHVCPSGCSRDCPPCDHKCESKCLHSKCNKPCSIPCIPCKENCTYSCEHRKCSNKCSDLCSTKPCDKPCPKKLEKCGHECIGFCGERCPQLCRICDSEELQDLILCHFGEDDDARFIKLECNHVMESRDMDEWMKQASEEISVKKCPHCNSPIYNLQRYKEIIHHISKDINKIKQKAFTPKGNIMKEEIVKILVDPNIKNFCGENYITQIKNTAQINKTKKSANKLVSDNRLKLCLFQAKVLQKLSSYACEQEVSTLEIDALKTLLLKRAMGLNDVSEQLYDEFSCEIQRLHILPVLHKLSKSRNPSVIKIHRQIETLMNPTIKFDESLEKNVKKLVKESEKYVGILALTETERMGIVSAMGLTQGHWYKCPNGHIYCIADCGRAVVEGKCPECNARIGGVGCMLRQDNNFAPEMDGASVSAYPTGY